VDTSVEVVQRYLQDAIAAEKNFETQLQSFLKEAADEAAKTAFQEHLMETRSQIERLTGRLEQLGGAPSTAKNLLAYVLNLAPKFGLSGQEKERNTQNLIAAFGIENYECAMYESLASMASAAGDPDTAALARSILQEEKRAATRIWDMLGTVAHKGVATQS